MGQLDIGTLFATLALRDNISAQLAAAAGTVNASSNLMTSSIEAVAKQTARTQAAINDFSGLNISRQASAYSDAIEHSGGVTKLTASQQQQANYVFTEAAEKLKLLGL